MESQPLGDTAIPSKPTLQVELPLQEGSCWLSLFCRKTGLGCSGRTFSSRTHSKQGRAQVTKVVSLSPLHFSETKEDSPSH